MSGSGSSAVSTAIPFQAASMRRAFVDHGVVAPPPFAAESSAAADQHAAIASAVATGAMQTSEHATPALEWRAWPSVPFYGLLQHVTVEVRHRMRRTGTAGQLSPVDAPATARCAAMLPSALEHWGRRGGGMHFRFGTHPGLTASAAVDAALPPFVVGKSGASQQPSAQTDEGAAVNDAVEALIHRKRLRSNDGRGWGADVTAPVAGTATRNTPHPSDHTTSAPLVAASCAAIAYGEYLEALTDACMTFFSPMQSGPGKTGGGQGAASSSPTLSLDIQRHKWLKELHAFLFYENGARCAFVASSHRPTQRYLTERCAEVGLSLDWVSGAAFVSSSPSSSASAATPLFPVHPLSLQPQERPNSRQLPTPDPTRVLVDVLLNTNLCSISPAGEAVPQAAAALPATSPSSWLSAGCEVTLLANFPFQHATLQYFLLRRVGTTVVSQRASGLIKPPTSTSIPSSSGAAAVDDDVVIVAEQFATTAGLTRDSVLAIDGGAAVVGRTCRSAPPMLFGAALDDLVRILTEEVRVTEFRILCEPKHRISIITGGRVEPNTTTAAKTSGASSAAVGGFVVSGSGRRATNPAARDFDDLTYGRPCAGLAASRLCSFAWLSEREQRAAALLVKETRQQQARDEAVVEGVTDFEDGAALPHSDDDEGDEMAEPEVEFFPADIHYCCDALPARNFAIQNRLIRTSD